MRVPGSAVVLESRRRRALALVQQGRSLNAAARRIGCAASSVLRWWRAFRRHGAEGLKVRRASGRPPRLSARQRQGLLKQLLRGPMAHGYPTDLWTTQRIAEVIERRYGVRYHRNHVSWLLAQLDLPRFRGGWVSAVLPSLGGAGFPGSQPPTWESCRLEIEALRASGEAAFQGQGRERQFVPPFVLDR